MTLPLAIGSLIAGLALLFIGGEMLVNGSVRIARRLGLGEIFIGIVLIGFGTSAPEMLATARAAMLGDAGLGLGNIIGSNIANVGLVTGFGLLLASVSDLKGLSREKPNLALMWVGLIIFGAVLLTQPILTFTSGVFLIIVLLAALSASYWLSLKQEHAPEVDEDDNPDAPLWRAWLLVFAGLALLALGADWLVKGAIFVAASLGVPQHIIGLSIVAFGTSLPELAATVAAARHGKITLVIGNVLGSNLFNVLGAAGVGALFGGLQSQGLAPDYVIMLLFSAILGLLMLKSFRRPTVLGSVMLAGYLGYIGWLVIR